MSESDPRDAFGQARTVLVVSAIGNILLSGVKILVGLGVASQALIADGVHSLSDLVTDGVVWFGIRMGRAEADANHHFGHDRIETLAGLGVGLVLALTGAGLGFDSIHQLIDRRFAPASLWAAVVAAISMGGKEYLFRYTRRVGRRIGSTALEANAWHHRSDALSSLAVLIGVGAGLISPRLVFMDRVAALFVAVMILKVAWDIGRGAVLEVVDTAPPREVVDRMTAIVSQVPGVVGPPECRIRSSGTKILMECTVKVDGGLTLREAHVLSERVERAVHEVEPAVAECIVHVEPA